MSRPTLYFMHGWAFDASVWTPLAAALSDWPQVRADAGYFGPASLPAVDGPVIAIGHSLGGLKLLASPPAGCQGLVLINSFARFAAAADFPAGVPLRMLTRMQQQLSRHAATVVTDFRQRAGSTAAIAGTLDEAALQADLTLLMQHDCRAELAAWNLPLCSLAARQDTIVPPALSQASLPADTEWHEAGGHLLPLSEPDWCAQTIRRFLQALPQ